MAKYAVYFSRYYAMSVEAEDPDQAVEKATQEFIEDEANAASTWVIDQPVDKLEA